MTLNQHALLAQGCLHDDINHLTSIDVLYGTVWWWIWLLVSQYAWHTTFLYSELHAFYAQCHPVLTLFWRSGLAPALRRSSTTFWWPLKLARLSTVQPFCMVEWVIVTTRDDCTWTEVHVYVQLHRHGLTLHSNHDLNLFHVQLSHKQLLRSGAACQKGGGGSAVSSSSAFYHGRVRMYAYSNWIQ